MPGGGGHGAPCAWTPEADSKGRLHAANTRPMTNLRIETPLVSPGTSCWADVEDYRHLAVNAL